MAIPRITHLQLESITTDEDDGVALNFRPARAPTFIAGQHAFWQVPGGGIHPFTIASAPNEDIVTLGTRFGSGTRLKRALAALTADDVVRLIGPLGSFTLEGTEPGVVMLAQGVGVTPFRSMLRQLGGAKRTKLVQVGVRHPFRADTEPLAGRSMYVRSRSAFATALDEVTADPRATTYFVSGSVAFVGETVTALRERSIQREAIRRDRFWGASTGGPEQVAAA